MRPRWLFLVCLFLFPAFLAAQVISTSQIRGTVEDTTGAAVPDAQVTLTNTLTGVARTTTSAGNGSYAFPDLNPATYQLTVTKEGFQKFVQNNIVVVVSVNPTINATLQVGTVAQKVEVTGATAPLAETQNATVSTVTPPQMVQSLPLNNRDLVDIFQFSGATMPSGNSSRSSYTSNTGAVSSVSIGGSLQGGVSYWLDGGTYNDPLSNQNLPLPFPDTIEEFSLQTSAAPAQYGVHAGGDVNVVTKSGTNEFHGDAFDYVRNLIFDSRSTGSYLCAAPFTPAQRAANCPRDNLKRNEFGATIGGPIKKDKLFFFAGWQDDIQISSSQATASLPTPDMLAGNFQPCLGSTTEALGAPFGPAYNPTYGINQTDPANFSPVITQLLKYLPASNPAVNACGQNAYVYTTPQRFSENQGLGRLDYHPNSSQTIFGRYFITHYYQSSLGVPPLGSAATGNPYASPTNPNLVLASVSGADDIVQSLTLGDTWLIGSNMVNSIRATGDRSDNLTILNNEGVGLYDLFSGAGLTVPTTNVFQIPTGPKFVPGFSTTNNSFAGIGTETPNVQPYDTLEFSDDFTMMHGGHQISFGVDFINLRAFALNQLNNQGIYLFDGQQTSPGKATAASGLPDFLLGETATAIGFMQNGPIPSKQHQNIFALYVQDAWKLNRKLTLTLGLRWDPFFGHTVPGGLDAVTFSIPNVINDVHSVRFPNAPAGYLFNGDPGAPTGNKITPNALDKWSPRIGVAWDPKGDGRMSVRAGFGIFYDFPNFAFDQLGFEQPYGGKIPSPAGINYATGCPAGGPAFPCSYDLTNPWAAESFITGSGTTVPTGTNPFPNYVGQGPEKSAYLPDATQFSYPQGVKPTYVMQYNLTIQKQVGANWLLSVGYLGNQMRHLWGNVESNPGIQGPCGSAFAGQGAFPMGYPLPAGVTCSTVAPGASATTKTIAGPCSPTLPPFACHGNGSLYLNTLFYHYNDGNPVYMGSLCANPAVTPFASCYGEDMVLDEGGTGHYDALLLSAQHRFGGHYTSTTNFTWSHCLSSNYTTAVGLFLYNDSTPYYPQADRGNCPNGDQPIVFNQAFVAQMPKLSISNGFLRVLASDWSLSVDGIVASGMDLSGSSGPYTLFDYSGSSNGFTQRPNYVTGQNPYCHPTGRSCWLNPNAFADPAPYTFSNLGAGAFRGPGFIIVNTAIQRSFPIKEGQSLQFRWEMFNMPNHANLGAPVTAFFVGPSSPNFGKANLSSSGPQAGRVMQFALKYAF